MTAPCGDADRQDARRYSASVGEPRWVKYVSEPPWMKGGRLKYADRPFPPLRQRALGTAACAVVAAIGLLLLWSGAGPWIPIAALTLWCALMCVTGAVVMVTHDYRGRTKSHG
jgi:hypothetical protein